MGLTFRRAVATALFGIVAIMALKALLAHGASAAEYLTGALAFATAVYGWFTSETVTELQMAREATIAPILIPFVKILDRWNNQGSWGVKNIGLGPALEVNVSLSYGK